MSRATSHKRQRLMVSFLLRKGCSSELPDGQAKNGWKRGPFQGFTLIANNQKTNVASIDDLDSADDFLGIKIVPTGLPAVRDFLRKVDSAAVVMISGIAGSSYVAAEALRRDHNAAALIATVIVATIMASALVFALIRRHAGNNDGT